MNNLDDYIIYDSETQYDRDHGFHKDYLFQIYGVTEGGILFERDLKDTSNIILHVGTGIKMKQGYLDRDSFFFRKNQPGSNFFANYESYKDFDFNKKDNISKEYIIQIVKRFIYMECPSVWSSTCMGGGRKGVLGNPNWQYGTFLFEDEKEYTVIKRYDTVKIFEGRENMYAFEEKEPYCSFKLDEDLYKKAKEYNSLRKFIALNTFGFIDIEKMKRCIELYEELDINTKIGSE